MSSKLYLEGGAGDSKEMQSRCREGFRKLLENCGFDRMPRLVACGGRESAFDNFKTAHKIKPPNEYVAMLIDSEDPVVDQESTWEHLKKRDQWDRPAAALNEQILFMATCMETWIVADRVTLTEHFKNLQENALPPLTGLENRHRHDVQDRLTHATRDCSNAYAKGERSFKILGKLRPTELRKFLPQFVRVCRILDEKL